jgi:hypothetical protein
MDNLNIFQESENFWDRFSTIMFVLFVYYSICYYGILSRIKCRYPFPSVGQLLCVMIFHILQVVVIRKVFDNDESNMSYIWGMVFLPVIIYLCLIKYHQNSIRNNNNNNIAYHNNNNNNRHGHLISNPLVIPQDTSTTGIQTEMLKEQQQQQLQLQQQQQQQNLLSINPQTLNNQQRQELLQSTQLPTYNDYVAQYQGPNNFTNSLTPF